jgi:chromosome segregation ATPase
MSSENWSRSARKIRNCKLGYCRSETVTDQMRYRRANELGSALNELEQVKGALAANATESQNLVAKQHEYSRLLTESRQTVSTLSGERERLAAEIAELADEKNGMSIIATPNGLANFARTTRSQCPVGIHE